jgi:hypothetical protein
LSGGTAYGSSVLIFAIELGESYGFVAGDGYDDGDGSGWNSVGWSYDGDDLSDGDGSACG